MFCHILKRLRKEKGYTQQELANILGVGKSTISMYEVGERVPDYDMLAKIAQVFNVDINILFGTNTPQTRKTAPTPMTEAEAALLELFKRVPADKQNLVLGMIRAAIESQG